MTQGFEKHWAISSEQFAFHYAGLALTCNKIKVGKLQKVVNK